VECLYGYVWILSVTIPNKPYRIHQIHQAFDIPRPHLAAPPVHAWKPLEALPPLSGAWSCPAYGAAAQKPGMSTEILRYTVSMKKNICKSTNITYNYSYRLYISHIYNIYIYILCVLIFLLQPQLTQPSKPEDTCLQKLSSRAVLWVDRVLVVPAAAICTTAWPSFANSPARTVQ